MVFLFLSHVSSGSLTGVSLADAAPRSPRPAPSTSLYVTQRLRRGAAPTWRKSDTQRTGEPTRLPQRSDTGVLQPLLNATCHSGGCRGYSGRSLSFSETLLHLRGGPYLSAHTPQRSMSLPRHARNQRRLKEPQRPRRVRSGPSAQAQTAPAATKSCGGATTRSSTTRRAGTA